MAQEKKYIPELRFPEFKNDGEWTVKVLDDILVVNSGKDYKHLGLGDIPVYGTGGYLLSVDDKLSEIDAVGIGRKGTIDKPQYLKAPFWTVDTLFFLTNKEGYNIQFLYYLSQTIDWKKYSEQGVLPSLSKSTIESIKVVIPNCLNSSIAEQKKVAHCMSSLDDYIEATNHKLRLLKEHKKGLMQRLFPAKGKTTPELSFPEFQKDRDWRTMSLGEITSVVNRRNKSNRSLPIYSINNTDGFVPQSQQFVGMDSEVRGYDISAYKIVGKHTFAYNPARINVGSIGYSGGLKDILISSLYVCFKTTDDVDDDFLMCFFNSNIFNQAVESNVEGGIRSYLFYENFSRISIVIPSLDEQKRIASCITGIEDMIKKTNEQISLLETHKKGLLQQLFTTVK